MIPHSDQFSIDAITNPAKDYMEEIRKKAIDTHQFYAPEEALEQDLQGLDKSQSKSALIQAVKINEKYAEAIAQRSKRSRQREDDDAAMDDLNAAVNIQHEDREALSKRMKATCDSSDREQLQSLDEQVIRCYSNILVSRSNALREIDRFDEAMDDLDVADQLRPNQKSVIVSRAATYLQSLRYNEALTEIDKVLAIESHDPITCGMKGEILYCQGRLDVALPLLDEAVLHWDHPLPHDIKAKIFLEQNNYEAALAELEAIIRICPNDNDAIQRRNELLEQLGHSDTEKNDLNTF